MCDKVTVTSLCLLLVGREGDHLEDAGDSQHRVHSNSEDNTTKGVECGCGVKECGCGVGVYIGVVLCGVWVWSWCGGV